MVKIERSYPAPESLSQKQSYREDDIIQRLEKDFNGKCYICELDKLSDINVEHLNPHKGDENKKYDWDNLFLSCPHCNSVKNKREYDDKILDCCKVDPEEKINFDFDGKNIKVFAKDESDEKAVKTASLVYEVFNIKNTGMRVYTSAFRLNSLQKEMTIFFKALERYIKENDKMSLRILKSKLRRESGFAAFKRAYIRKNYENYKNYSELEDIIRILEIK